MDKSLSNELEPRNKNQGVACHQRKSSVFDFKTLGQPMIFQGQVNLAYFGSLTWPGKVTGWPGTLMPGTIGFLSWQATRRFLFHGTSWSGSQLSKCCEFLYCILMEKEKVSLLMGFPKKKFLYLILLVWSIGHRMESWCKLLGQACPSKSHQYSQHLVWSPFVQEGARTRLALACLVTDSCVRWRGDFEAFLVNNHWKRSLTEQLAWWESSFRNKVFGPETKTGAWMRLYLFKYHVRVGLVTSLFGKAMYFTAFVRLCWPVTVTNRSDIGNRYLALMCTSLDAIVQSIVCVQYQLGNGVLPVRPGSTVCQFCKHAC